MRSVAAKAYSGRGSIAGISLLLGTSCSLLFEPTLANDAGEAPSDARPLAGDAEAPRAMLTDNFESGERAGRWQEDLENGDSCEVTSEVAAGGSTYSMRCSSDQQSGTGAYIYLDFVPTQTLKVEMDVRFDTLPTTGGKWLAYLQASNGSTRLTNSDLYQSRKIDVWSYGNTSSQYAKDAGGADLLIDTGTWYHIMFVVQIGEVSISVGSEASARLNLPDMLPIDRLLLGITLVDDSIEQHTMYMDNIAISEH